MALQFLSTFADDAGGEELAEGVEIAVGEVDDLTRIDTITSAVPVLLNTKEQRYEE